MIPLPAIAPNILQIDGPEYGNAMSDFGYSRTPSIKNTRAERIDPSVISSARFTTPQPLFGGFGRLASSSLAVCPTTGNGYHPHLSQELPPERGE
jgi:hypothetical protein